MKKLTLLIVAAMAMVVFSCEKEDVTSNEVVPQSVIDQLYGLGFNPDGIERVKDGYRIERDIIITDEYLSTQPVDVRVPNAEQYRTSNVVNTGGSRDITVYMEVETSGGGGGGGNGNGNGNGNGRNKNTSSAAFPSTYDLALNEAIARFNGENLDLTFSRTSDPNAADIVVTRLGKRDERRGVLGSAGFPTGGNPYNQILMSGVLETSFGLSVNGIATIIAHEMGHCIGFRHTDYFDRSISCGGTPTDEGQAGVGAILIPGTPSGASLSDASWMLSCSDGSDRPFNGDDSVALQWMYSGNY